MKERAGGERQINRQREGKTLKVDIFKAKEKGSFKLLFEAGLLFSVNRARPHSPNVTTDMH